MVRYDCGPAGEGTTPRRTHSCWPVGSTYARCTSICSVCTYESKKPGQSSKSSLKTIPTRDTLSSSFESWPIFDFDTWPSRSYVAVVAIVPTAWRDGRLPRDPGANQVDRITWTGSRDGGGTRWLTGVGLSDGVPQGAIEIGPDEQGAFPRVICK